MNANKIKLIACISMLIDHMGFLLFPQYAWMRSVGRLAMPLFGFFIAEGTRYTSNRTRYFLRTFLLGIGCQAVYFAEEFLSGGVRSVYLNILFTLSISMLVCFAYVDFEKSLKNKEKNGIFLRFAVFALSVASVIAFDIFCTFICRSYAVCMVCTFRYSDTLFLQRRARKPQIQVCFLHFLPLAPRCIVLN